MLGKPLRNDADIRIAASCCRGGFNYPVVSKARKEIAHVGKFEPHVRVRQLGKRLRYELVSQADQRVDPVQSISDTTRHATSMIEADSK